VSLGWRDRMPRVGPAVAYLIKGWPRVSELFIASEVYRMEQLGLRVRLYAIKPGGEARVHPVVTLIEAPARYLPRTSPLSADPFPTWLRRNLPLFVPGLRRVMRRHPLRLARATAAALAQSVRARESRWTLPRGVYAAELLRAVALADALDAAGDVGHLHAHFAHGATTVAWLASLITGLPFSFTGHAKDIYQVSQNPAGLLRRKMRAATFVATCTRANYEHLRRIAPEANVQLVYHGLNADFARLVAGGVPREAPNDHLRIVSVGRMVPKKGHDIFLHALAYLARNGLQFEAVIAGEPDTQEAEIRQLIDALGLSGQVKLLGVLSQAELLEEYRRSHLFALACRITGDGDRDGIPNVMVEAMACGLPVVATAVSGVPELVHHGRNGLLVAPEDPEALADAMLRIVRDPALAAHLSAGAVATVRERFDGDALARRMVELLDVAR